MSYIIGNKCVSVCDTSCVKVCPVDAINGPKLVDGVGSEVENMTKEELIGLQLYINPNTCIDCGACVPECPVDAIFKDEQEAVALGDKESIEKNYGFYGLKFNKTIL